MLLLLSTCSTEALTGVAANEASGATATQSARNTEAIFLNALTVRFAIREINALELSRSR
jgi:hypothetical protein